MAGNVWEWIQDWYDSDYYEESPKKNPTGPDDGKKRVIRSGSWLYDPGTTSRSANRLSHNPVYTLRSIGFRCAMDIAE